MNRKLSVKKIAALILAAVVMTGMLPQPAGIVYADQPPTEIDTNTTSWSGAMYVSDTVTIDSNVTLAGATTLTIAEGKTLTINGRIGSANGFNDLTINGPGNLRVDYTNDFGSVISVSNFTLNGGTVTAANHGSDDGVWIENNANISGGEPCCNRGCSCKDT